LKESTTTNRTVQSIWRTDKPTAVKESSNLARHRQACRDPTAKTAIDNILREERKVKRKKQLLENGKRRA